MKKGKEYELLVEQIYRDLQGDAEIIQDDFIKGVESGIDRQIDVSIRYKIADIPLLLIVQAKDWTRKADVKVVGEFISVIRDVRAQKGILVCNAGFSKAAIQYARKEHIQLYSAHTALNKKWDMELKIPVIKYEDEYNFIFQTWGDVYDLAGQQVTMNTAQETHFLVGDQIVEFHVVLNQALEGTVLDKSGKKHKISFSTDNVYSNRINNVWRPVKEVTYEYSYKRRVLSYSYFSPHQYRALKDYISDKTVHSFISFDHLLPFLIDKSLWKTSSISDLPFDLKLPHLVVDAINLGVLYKYTAEFKI